MNKRFFSFSLSNSNRHREKDERNVCFVEDKTETINSVYLNLFLLSFLHAENMSDHNEMLK